MKNLSRSAEATFIQCIAGAFMLFLSYKDAIQYIGIGGAITLAIFSVINIGFAYWNIKRALWKE